ncbi:GNAT family N-acetyltransferase [Streptomyces sp. NPDC004051]
MIESHRTTDSLVIRTALAAEAADIAALHLRARSTYYPDGLPEDGAGWSARWQEAVEHPDGQVLCSVRDGHLAGIASFRTPQGAPADTVKLFQFHVDPDRWRAGIGTALHTACVEEWRANGRRTAVLEVHADNRRAQAFYTRRGWIPDPGHPPAEDDHHLHLCFAVPGE